ncbi:hypothetical protein [Bifidobacterium bohemicum]|uniref:hypothetical protein n=1 Tax=Bifidobacterium bohemicum TaxID=638617 RepID=UPI000A73CB29|nr:hypothetical protein [Bifidobacterium bohemicum]
MAYEYEAGALQGVLGPTVHGNFDDETAGKAMVAWGDDAAMMARKAAVKEVRFRGSR